MLIRLCSSLSLKRILYDLGPMRHVTEGCPCKAALLSPSPNKECPLASKGSSSISSSCIRVVRSSVTICCGVTWPHGTASPSKIVSISRVLLSPFRWPIALPSRCVATASLSLSDLDRFRFAPHRFGGILNEVTSTVICPHFSHLSTCPHVTHAQ